jgi:protein-tyrosine phosphatase/membrane-associated phospholipid phosphatase
MRDVHGLARPPRALSAATAAWLSLLFIAVYGGTGWLTSVRSDVGTWWFAWERSLPLVPALIVPYMSLDLFFVAAPFLCVERAELRTFRRRITAAILAAGALFVAMPLEFAFPRPHPDGWPGAIFAALHGFDRPYNLFPSLHIAILLIVSGPFLRHTRGVVRMLVAVWFGLIAVSTVFTYQHHVIDVAGGIALATLCCYAIAESPAAHPAAANSRLGAWYAGGAAMLAALAGWFAPWGWVLLWPAGSMAIVAGAYFGFYGAITRKSGGRLPLAARLILAPWLAGQRLSLLYYRRQASPWNEMAPGVWMGRQLTDREAARAVAEGATAVLDLTGEFSEASTLLSLNYLNLAVLDLTAPTPVQLRAAIDFINAHRRAGAVFVHCKIGYSRSAAVMGCWLLDAGLAVTANDAVARMRVARPALVVRAEAWRALRQFSRGGNPLPETASSTLLEART